MDQSVVTVRELRKTYGAFEAVSKLNLNITSGEFFGLLGPNGAGKSTLMSIITGIDAPDSGDVSICGETVHTAQQIPDIGIGLCPQKDILFSFLTVEEHTRLYASFRNDDDNIDEEVERILLSVGLWESGHREKLVKDLSGGLKRRLTLALALLFAPSSTVVVV